MNPFSYLNFFKVTPLKWTKNPIRHYEKKAKFSSESFQSHFWTQVSVPYFKELESLETQI